MHNVYISWAIATCICRDESSIVQARARPLGIWSCLQNTIKTRWGEYQHEILRICNNSSCRVKAALQIEKRDPRPAKCRKTLKHEIETRYCVLCLRFLPLVTWWIKLPFILIYDNNVYIDIYIMYLQAYRHTYIYIHTHIFMNRNKCAYIYIYT